MLTELADLVDEATAAFDRFDYARALERTEAHFWSFCDDYLELVKNRAYAEGAGRRVGQGRPRPRPRRAPQAVRAVPALRHRRGVVVVAGGLASTAPPGPTPGPLRAAAADADPLPLRVAADVLTELRRAKSEGKRSMRAPIERVVVTDTAERLAALDLVVDDVTAAGVVDRARHPGRRPPSPSASPCPPEP